MSSGLNCPCRCPYTTTFILIRIFRNVCNFFTAIFSTINFTKHYLKRVCYILRNYSGSPHTPASPTIRARVLGAIIFITLTLLIAQFIITDHAYTAHAWSNHLHHVDVVVCLVHLILHTHGSGLLYLVGLSRIRISVTYFRVIWHRISRRVVNAIGLKLIERVSGVDFCVCI